MWISVHDSIDGPKLRDLYKKLEISKFEATGILVYLWQWGLHNADKEGLLLNVDSDDIERYLHSVANGCSSDEHDIFEALLETGWIDEMNGNLYLHDWETWQKEWYKYQSRLKKDVERKRNAALLIAKNKESQETEIVKDEEKKTEEPKKKSKTDYSEEFIRFYDLYPRRGTKAEAFKCFKARINDGFKAEDIIKAAMNYAEKCRKNHTDEQYIMLPKTFLSTNLRFMEYLPKESGSPQFSGDTGNPFDRYVEN